MTRNKAEQKQLERLNRIASGLTQWLAVIAAASLLISTTTKRKDVK